MSNSDRLSLVERRQKLRQQRHSERWRLLWRFGFTAALCAGSFMLLQQPWWLIQSEAQLEISGNDLISDRQVLDLLPLPYPLPIWAVQPQALEQQLQQYPLIQTAQIERRLVPLRIEITLIEREPLATSVIGTVPGIVDRAGIWVPQQIYTDLPQLPSLRILGYPEHPPEHWQTLLAIVGRSPVAIEAVNWEDLDNLVFTSEIAIVHLGSYNNPEQMWPQIQRQLQALDYMRDLGQYCQCQLSDIDHIDLRNPSNPTLALTEAAAANRFMQPEIPLVIDQP